jgi:hypothetical protein
MKVESALERNELTTVGVRHSLPGQPLVGEHHFFLSMCVLIFAAVLYGFGSEYVRFRTDFFPFPSLLVYIHAALFFAWMLLLLAQASLVSAGRVAWHRRLGMAGFFLVCAMPIVGALTVTAFIARNGSPPPGFDSPWVFYYDSMASLLAFLGLAGFALRYRRSPDSHKRLILLATMVIAEAGIFRWPVRWIHAIPHGVTMITYSFLLLLVLYDFYSRKKIHPATLWGGAFLVLYEETQSLIGNSPAWHGVALWILHFWPKSG